MGASLSLPHLTRLPRKGPTSKYHCTEELQLHHMSLGGAHSHYYTSKAFVFCQLNCVCVYIYIYMYTYIYIFTGRVESGENWKQSQTNTQNSLLSNAVPVFQQRILFNIFASLCLVSIEMVAFDNSWSSCLLELPNNGHTEFWSLLAVNQWVELKRK